MGAEKGFGLDGGYVIGGYVAGPRSCKTAVIVVPNDLGWRTAGVRRVIDRAADALSGDAPVTVCCPDVHRGNTWIDAGPSDGGKERWEEWVASHPAERVAKDIAAVASALKEGGASTVVVVGCGWHPAIAAALAADAGQPSAFTYARCPALEALLTSLGSAAGGGGGPSAGAGAEQERDLLVENAAADAIEELRKAIATA